MIAPGLGPEHVLRTERLVLRPATTADSSALLEHALGPLGLPEVLAEVDEGNSASVAVVKRLGMTSSDVVPGLLGPVTRYRHGATRSTLAQRRG